MRTDQLANLCHHGRPPWPASLVAVVFSRDQLPMPGEQGVRAHNGADLPEDPPAQVFRLGGQANALIVGASQPPRPELLAEHPILRLEILDHLALLRLIQPARATRSNWRGCESGDISAAYQRPERRHPIASGCSHIPRLDLACRDVDRILGH